MGTFRTAETEAAYQKLAPTMKERECPLCLQEPLKAFTYWKVIPNDFPYDRVAKIHHMIVPLRHVTERELSDEEKRELQDIKDGYLNDHYEYLVESTHRRKSIPDHFHLHLIVAID